MLLRTTLWLSPIGLCTALLAQSGIAFDPMVFEPMNADPHAVALGDLNADGLLDAAVCVGEGGVPENEFKVRVYLQEPTGGLVYSAQYPFPGTAAPRAIAVGDVNNDGLDDIVLGYGNSVGVFGQNAQHTFEALVPMVSGSQVDGLAVGDLNNDGLTDIVSAHMYEDYINVFLQTTGGFSAVSYPHPTAGRNELNVGDLNGDGLDDVLLMPGQFSTSLYLFVQNTSGGLEPYVEVSAGPSNSLYDGSAIGDVNGDGLIDAMATRGGKIPDSRLVIWHQNSGSNLLESSTQISLGDLPDAVETADLDCDGHLELLVMHPLTIRCYQQDGDGVYDAYTVHQVPYSTMHEPQTFAVGDLDNDGRPDIITATYQGVSFLKNRTMPEILDSVLSIVSLDTTFTDTVFSWDAWVETQVDTSGSYVISTTSYFEANYDLHLDSVRTDSLVVSYGTMCDRTVVDSLATSYAMLIRDTIWTDTSLMMVFIDTLFAIGIHELKEVMLAVSPNPSNGLVRISAPVGANMNGSPLIVLDANGRVVRRGTVRRWPVELDLGGEPCGAYLVTVLANERTLVGTVMLTE